MLQLVSTLRCSNMFRRCGSVVEHLLGKKKVMGSIPIIGSNGKEFITDERSRRWSVSLLKAQLGETFDKYSF